MNRRADRRVDGDQRPLTDGGTPSKENSEAGVGTFDVADPRFVALFENFPEPTIAYRYEDDEPVIVAVNAAFERVFGYDREQACGEPVDDLIVPPDRQDEAEVIDRRVQRGEHVDEELRRQMADGVGDFWFRNIQIDDDELDGFAVYTDVTERKQGKRELERQNERLERFATVVSHDLRNPLNVAMSRLELADDSPHVEEAMDSLDRMEGLIDDLLEVARAGRSVDVTTEVAFAEMVDECWTNVETGDTVLVRECPAETTIRANRTQLAQLFENLIRNAIEHGHENVTGDSGGTGDITGDSEEERADENTADEVVTITIGCSPEDGTFYVADDGPGIPEEERDAVFDLGYSTSEGGGGLGLNIVREVAEAHGWSVRVTESDAGGARFEVHDVEIQ